MSRLCRITSPFALVLLLAMSASGQCSSALAVTGTTFSGGDTLSFGVTGAPADAATAVFISPAMGNFSFGPLLALDLAAPAIPIGIGQTDSNGDFTATVNLPPIPAGTLGDIDLYSQAATLSFALPTAPTGGGGPPLPFTFCTSNVVMVTVSL